MKKILVIHQSAELYGSDRTLLLLLEQFDKSRFFPVVVLPSEGPLKAELEKLNIKVVIAPVAKVYRKMFTFKNLFTLYRGIGQAVKTIDALHREHQFDMVYSNTLAVLLGMIYARKRKLKHIWHVHEIIQSPGFVANTFPILLNKFSDVVICNSYATEDNLTKRVKALKNKCVVVHNGLDPDENVSVPADKKLKIKFGFAETDIVVTLLGRIGWFKGHKWLLSAYLKFLKESNIKMLFVGSPVPGQENYQHDLEDIITQKGIGDSVKIISFTRDLKSIWAATDITVVPSTEAEPFGLVALEGMLARKPVVAANHGGLKEIVVPHATGLLVEPSNDEELADALLMLARDKTLRESMGKTGYERAISEFSLKKYIIGMVEVFESQS